MHASPFLRLLPSLRVEHLHVPAALVQEAVQGQIPLQ